MCLPKMLLCRLFVGMELLLTDHGLWVNSRKKDNDDNNNE